MLKIQGTRYRKQKFLSLLFYQDGNNSMAILSTKKSRDLKLTKQLSDEHVAPRIQK